MVNVVLFQLLLIASCKHATVTTDGDSMALLDATELAADSNTTPTWSISNYSDGFSGGGGSGGGCGGHEVIGSLDVYLVRYVAPIIFALGLIGNTLTVFIMRRPRFQGSTTSVYMPFIATFDTLTLISEVLPAWMEACGFCAFKEVHPATCKLIKLIAYSTGDSAIWGLVAFTFDRFVAVCFPLKKRVVCTHRRAVIISAVLFVCAIVKNIHVFLTRGAVYDDGMLISNCGKPKPWTHFEKFVRPWLAFALVNVLPFTIILCCNIMIVKSLLKNTAIRRTTTLTSSKSGHTKGRPRPLSQTTIMCLSISVAFLILLSPSIVMLIGKPYWKSKAKPYRNAKALASLLMYVHHSCNFFLYCLTGSAFREELIGLFKRDTKQVHNSLSDSSTMKVGVSPKTTNKLTSPQFFRKKKKGVKELAEFAACSLTDGIVTSGPWIVNGKRYGVDDDDSDTDGEQKRSMIQESRL